MFPVVLRSDNAAELVGAVIEELNKLFEIKHITGSSYHPQSQGTVESMRKILNSLVGGLCQDHPEDWESRVPFVESILRCTPLRALGGRCPYEVVTGMKPRLPRGLDPGKPVIAQDVGTYVKKLEEFYKDAYTEIQRLQLEATESNEGDGNKC